LFFFFFPFFFVVVFQIRWNKLWHQVFNSISFFGQKLENL